MIGVDAPADARALSADFVNLEWSWKHAGQTALDAVALIPVVGAVKYADEAAALVKNGNKALEAGTQAAKNADELGEAVKGEIKKSRHAIIRSEQGRNVNTAINDINKSSPAKIYLQDDGRIVVRGDKGRVHILESDGEIVTTMNKVPNFNDRVLSGRYRPLSEGERIEFANKFDEYLGGAWNEYRNVNRK